MKRIALISIISGGDGGNTLLRDMYEKVAEDIPGEFKQQYTFKGRGPLSLALEENSSSFSYIMGMCEEYRLHPTVFQKVHYTKSEVEKCEYFQMNIFSPLEIEGTNAADYGTQYENGCPVSECRLGKKLIGDVLIDRKFLNQKKWDIGTLRPDIYVSETLKDMIVSSGLTGVSFDHEVKDYKGREMPKYYIMQVENVLPSMASGTWLKHDEYSHPWYRQCGHQVVYLRSDVQYERDKLTNAKDFNLSTEYVDNFRLQEIIVSARVRKLFREHKIYARFFPVAIL